MFLEKNWEFLFKNKERKNWTEKNCYDLPEKLNSNVILYGIRMYVY